MALRRRSPDTETPTLMDEVSANIRLRGELDASLSRAASVINLLWPRIETMRSAVAEREHQDQPARRHRKLDAGTTAALLLVQAILQFPSLLRVVHWLGNRADDRTGRIESLDLPEVSESAITRAVRRLDWHWLLEATQTWAEDLPKAVLRELPAEVRRIFRSDGSWINAAPSMAFAARAESLRRAMKAVCSFARSGVIEVTVGGETNASERALLLSHLKAGDLHIVDRGFPSIGFFAAFLDRGAFFVARLSSSWKLVPKERRRLTAADRAAGILSDWIVPMGKEARIPVRVVHFRADGHDFRIATNLVTLAAWEIAELYRERWRVELLFRFVKSHLGRNVNVWDEAACVGRALALFLAALLVTLLTGVQGRHGLEPHAQGLRLLQAAIERAAVVGAGASP